MGASLGNNLDNNPQNGVQGSSYIYNFGTSPNTRTAVSQKVRILAPAFGDSSALHQMGVLSSFGVSESKTVEAVRGIGFGDTVAELVPSVTDPITISIERALLYLSDLWQATGYASGVDGPVRSLKHHKWPFDLEAQMVFSTQADMDIGPQFANVGYQGASGQFDGGVKAISFPAVTPDNSANPGSRRGHSAIITIYEACWWTSNSRTYAKDSGMIMESGGCMVTDVHDFGSTYGEFLATGNDPTLGQLGSIRFSEQGFAISQAGRGAGGGGSTSIFAQNAVNVAV